jgi:hypothetical protein
MDYAHLKKMELYHASTRIYAPGTRLTSRPRELSPDRIEAERVLAAYAPADARSRLSALFASDSAAFSARYLTSELVEGENKYLYRIHVPAASRHPMALVDIAVHAADESVRAAVAREYWHPTREWQCWEYLCSELEIVEEVPWPDLAMLAGASFRYGADREEARRLRP